MPIFLTLFSAALNLLLDGFIYACLCICGGDYVSQPILICEHDNLFFCLSSWGGLTVGMV